MCIVICRININFVTYFEFEMRTSHDVAKLLKATTTSKCVFKYANKD